MNDSLQKTFSNLCGHPLVALEPLKGGRNSRVWLLRGNGQNWVGKQYFCHPNDHRDRLGTEFGALRFLRAHAMVQVPEAIAYDRAAGMAVYSFLSGQAPLPGDPEHARAMGAFAKRLWDLRGAVTPADGIGFASEACLCAEEIVKQVRERFARLCACDPQTPLAAEVIAFVEKRLAPALEHWKTMAVERLGTLGHQLPQRFWTLSPSDFGLHNTLAPASGPLQFLDFEYFGWDDPAKLLSDALLHCGLPLSPDQKRIVAREFKAIFSDAGNFAARVRAYLPLLGLKWCCILCNEFVRSDMLRRRFVDTGMDVRQTRARQLAKAGQMLDHDIAAAIAVVDATF